MADIFISYAREDRSRIEPLAKSLEGLGWSVFWDRTIPAGKTWRQVIGEALKTARSVIVAWSQNSIESDWVQEEADRGRQRKILVPILLDNVDPPLGFGTIQAADLVNWDPAQSSPEFEKLIAAISIILGPSPRKVKEAEQGAEEERKRKEEEKSKRKDEERRKAEEESQRLEIEKRRIAEEKQKRAEVERKAEEKRERKEIEAKRKAEEERQRAEAEAKERAEEEQRRGEEKANLIAQKARKHTEPQGSPTKEPGRGQVYRQIPKNNLLRFSLISATLIIMIFILLLVYLVKPFSEKARGIEEGTLIELEIEKVENRPIDEKLIHQIIQIIEKRLQYSGVKSKNIKQEGNRKIIIQVDNTIKSQRLIDLVTKPAHLEFKVVDEEAPVSAEIPSVIKPWEEEGLLTKLSKTIPADDEILFEVVKDEKGKVVSKKPLLVKKRTLMTGEVLKDARVAIDSQFNEPYVALEFDEVGAKLFEQITGANTKKRLAIILDGNVYSAPVIQERIAGGRAQITGRFDMKEASDLAIVLRAGALPLPLSIIDVRELTKGSL